jgi:uncharacterized membrane protein YkvI
MKRLYRYIAPAAVIQSVMIGGGYGTGREVIEYFTRHGAVGGLLGLAVAFVCFFIIIAATYELARQWKSYDYQSFVTKLIGPFAILFEIAFLLLLVLVLAVIGSAAGDLLLETTGTPKLVSSTAMLLLVGFLTFWGRDTIISILTFWTLVLYVVFFLYFVTAFTSGYASLNFTISDLPADSTWLLDGVVYVMYNAAIVPVLLYSIRDFDSGKDSVIGGLLSALFVITPALLFHLTFIGAAESVLQSSTPLYESISLMSIGWLMVAYLCVLFGTFIETGLGLLQGVIERVDHAVTQRRGQPLSKLGHAMIAVTTLLASNVLALIGVVTLIGKGYRYMSFVFLALYVLPTLYFTARYSWRRFRPGRIYGD